MFKKLKEDQVFRDDIKSDVRNIFWLTIFSLIIGLPLTYLMYHPLYTY